MIYFVVENDDILAHWDKYVEKRKTFHNRLRKVLKKYGADEYLASEMGLLAVAFKKDVEVDKQSWKPFKSRSYSSAYCPRLNTKKGKELKKEFESLGDYQHSELRVACGFGSPIFHDDGKIFFGPSYEKGKDGSLIIGISEMCLDHSKTDPNYKLPEGLTEITYTDYKSRIAKA